MRVRRVEGLRRGFTVVVVPLILGIALVVLAIIYAVQNQTPITPNGPTQPSIKVMTSVAGFACWMFIMASPWAEKRGHTSANVFFGAILLIANLVMLNAVTGWSNSMRAKNAGRAATPMNSPSAVPPVASNPSGSPDVPATLPNTNETLGTRTPVTNQPTGTPGSPGADRPALHRTAVATKAAVDLEPLATTIKQEIASDLDARAKDAADVYTVLEKPRHDRKQIDDQIATLNKAKKDLEGTANRLRGISEEFRKRAEALGAGMSDSMERSIALNNEMESFEKHVACDSVARAAQNGKELLVVLRDNITKWTFNGKGEITTKDKQLEQQLFGPKAQVGFALQEKSRNLEALKTK